MGKGETVGAFYPIPFGTLKLSFVTRAIVMLDYEKQDCRTIYEASVFDFFLLISFSFTRTYLLKFRVEASFCCFYCFSYASPSPITYEYLQF